MRTLSPYINPFKRPISSTDPAIILTDRESLHLLRFEISNLSIDYCPVEGRRILTGAL